ncbi:hypothetical protein [uncultured Algibacter sp.]|uniref:hypothetical protein n=1 Tax=uncultured Algibacter sp. TaxID=298659 RepID=UPI002639A238|nr:hypothetical protein [uncultured Algibacter sp.]
MLPEISHSNITELNDVSAAYLFYDETKPDSVELNRKNLISTTNWLINVDKRLTLKQVIPHIKFLQEKKANSSHKNKNAKNYFTCNDTSRKNLGFIEFTDIMYSNQTVRDFYEKYSKKEREKIDQIIYLELISLDSIPVHFDTGKCGTRYLTNENDLLNGIKSDLLHYGNIKVDIGYNKNLSFQDYIRIKSKLKSFDLGHAKISNHEFIIDSQ